MKTTNLRAIQRVLARMRVWCSWRPVSSGMVASGGALTVKEER
jgi:hypothetical protein